MAVGSAPLDRTLRLSVLEGCVALVPSTFSTGVFLTGFALMLHADPWAIGLLTAIPAFGQAAQLVAAWHLGRRDDRKRLTVFAASAARYLWLVIAMIPFLPLGDGARLGLFFTLLALSTGLSQMAGVAWSAWMADLVPEHLRGRYFGWRNAINQTAGMAIVGVGTQFMARYQGPGAQAEGFLLLTLMAMVGAVASQLALSLQASPPVAQRPPATGLDALRAPLANAPFRRLMLLMVGWTFVVGLTGPFCYAYAMGTLHVDYASLGLHTMILTACGILSQPLWGKAIDRFGAQAALVTAMVPVCFHPLLWAFMRGDFLAPLWIDAVSSGFFWSGITLSTFALLMEVSPSTHRAAYMGLYNTVMGLSASLAALVGGLVLSLGATAGISLAGHALAAFPLLCLAGTALRLGCCFALRSLPRVAAPAQPHTVTIETRVAATPAPLPDDVVAAARIT